MTPLHVYLTRPNSQSIYLNGTSDVRFWLEPPTYSHFPVNNHSVRNPQMVDVGWEASRLYGLKAKKFLAQDDELSKKVWDAIFESLLPKGMTLSDGIEWKDKNVTLPDGRVITNWQSLYYDDEWEAKCNTGFKRFLIDVELRGGTVQRIKPAVHLVSADSKYNEWIVTDDCPTELATKMYYSPHSFFFHKPSSETVELR